jgi:hypothetical protein
MVCPRTAPGCANHNRKTAMLDLIKRRQNVFAAGKQFERISIGVSLRENRTYTLYDFPKIRRFKAERLVPVE